MMRVDKEEKQDIWVVGSLRDIRAQDVSVVHLVGRELMRRLSIRRHLGGGLVGSRWDVLA